MTANVTARFSQLDNMPELGALVRKSCSQLNIPTMTPPVPHSRPTNAEEENISQKAFGEEFKFSVDVNLVDSKAAFKILVGGLDSSNDFLGLWNLVNSDPRKHPHPIGDLDISPLDKERPKKEAENSEPEAEEPKTKKIKTDTA